MGKLTFKYTTLPEESQGSYTEETVKTTEAHVIDDMAYEDVMALIKRLLSGADVTLTAKLKSLN